MMNLDVIITAHAKMKRIVHETPLDYSKTFSDLSNNQVYLKLENLQKTGSFKVRGSFNKLISLSEEQRNKGVIAASAGNHAQGVAYSSNMLNLPCTIVMPKTAPLSKIQATKQYKAEVELYGSNFDEALNYALQKKEEYGATFVHPFDDDSIIAGQGTIALELIEQLREVDVVICPVGGGGLIAGVAFALKQLKPTIKVYGIQAAACPSMQRSLHNKAITTVPFIPTMADGISVRTPGNKTFELIQEYVDDIVCVDEMEIARTMLLLLERNKILVEASGASSLAALLYHKLPIKDQNVIAILSGGNVDVNFISRIIEHGMVESGRFVHLSTLLKDKPGHLQEVLTVISSLEANVLAISLDHIGPDIFPGYAKLRLSLETRSHEHIEEILKHLKNKGYHVETIV
ncbi:MAG: threonine ammonia-lyase [Bacillaceae bacterium]|nr:threonine ammonia-lyase [Bacillaceae bacterium]